MPDGAVEIRLAHVPDTITGNEAVETVEEKYKLKMALGVCNALQVYATDVFKLRFGGDMSRCVYEVRAGADIGFDLWKVKWPEGMAAWAKAAAQRARS